MQQIEEIRRMSELAKQMRELGLAKDNADAFNQARSVTSSDPEVITQRKQEELQNKVALLERKIESQQRSVDDLKAQLEAGGKSLAAALQQIRLLDEKLQGLQTANIAPVSAPVWNDPFPPQVQNQQKAPSTVPIDRNGVAPADVSVDKFFYFGNKR